MAAARGRLVPFVPVFLGTGVGLYFLLPAEPGPAAQALALAGALVAAGIALRGPEAARPLAAAAALVLAGLLLALLRSQAVAAPVLARHFHGAVEGRLVAIDRSLSDAVRLTLDRVVLEGLAPEATPARVRIALHGRAGAHLAPVPGMVVIATAHLSPPAGPAEPGGFDFRRHAWFEGLGAVGYTRTPVLMLEPPPAGPGALAAARLRARISAAVRAVVPGEAGAFAAAVLTGDRAGIGRPTLDALRDSSLAHLLAISGLHMGLLTAFVFALVRRGMALVPPLALRLPAKKIAAVLALAAAAFYLVLSGGNVATERAFVMVAVMLAAVLADRRAISLHSVAIAATLILVWQPEAMLGAGFQMSFAATVALVAAFTALSARARGRRLPPLAGAAAGLVMSSAVAGAATAPIAAAAFGRLADYGLLANVLGVPAMGTLVIPGAVFAGLLAPLGAEAPGLWAMEAGTRWILGVAHMVAGLDGAVTAVVAPPRTVLPLAAFGALWALLWPGRARLAGLLPVAVAAALWAGAPRPVLLVAETGTLIGVLGPQGRVLSKGTGETFVGRSWLESDGDAALPEAAAARPWPGPGPGRLVLGGVEVVHLAGRGARDRLEEACRPGAVVILGAAAPEAAEPRPCRLIDRAVLARTGALALTPGPGGLEATAAAGRAGRRPWTGPARPGGVGLAGQ
ncbi:MAG: ComEC/Rec2 family competence protein [Rhodobacteraceae bacterium]|nr:ComEC/Rec2 family competence protein [Paracoccaceae bacterium]